MWRVHHAQCPDPKGRVIFKIEQVSKINKADKPAREDEPSARRVEGAEGTGTPGKLRDLRIVVQEVKGKCTSGMRPGDYFTLRGGRLYIPAQRHFCLYALTAALPLLPAKQRPLEDGDWLKEDNHVICSDPAGNVILRIEQCP